MSSGYVAVPTDGDRRGATVPRADTQRTLVSPSVNAASPSATSSEKQEVVTTVSPHESTLPSTKTTASQVSPASAEDRSWISIGLFQAFALLWLVPIAVLLAFNFKGYRIGATAWCPNGHCFVDAFNPIRSIPEKNELNFDRHDHNLLGVLQLVAKALECWFQIIAVSLVYLLTMRLASKKEGLHIGYLTRPVEFGDLGGIFDASLWKSLPSLKDKHLRPLHMWAFIVFTVLLCGLCNLMGPATAVLAIPSLQWVTSDLYGEQAFASLNSGMPPAAGGFAFADSTCSENDFKARRYSCTQGRWGQSMDNWLSQFIQSNHSSESNVFLQQEHVSFALNGSFSGNSSSIAVSDYWMPSRQIMEDFSQDLHYIAKISQGADASSAGISQDLYDSYAPYNKSLRLQVQRNGPILGTSPNNWVDGLGGSSKWTIDVDSQRQVRCYSLYALNDYSTQATDGPAVVAAGNNYTKCIQLGTGWGPNTKHANFTVETPYNIADQKPGPNISIDVYSSDKAKYLLNGVLPAGIDTKCLAPGESISPNCDWNAFFSVDESSPLFSISSHVNTMEVFAGDRNANLTVAVDYVALLNFTDYTLDPSPLTNPLALVQTLDLPERGAPQPIDPAWTLAAWSVDEGGSVPSNRTISLLLFDVLQYFATGETNFPVDVNYAMSGLAFIPVLSTLSYLDYATGSGPAGETTPLLQRQGLMFIWAYGLGSRTSILGTVVACFGIAIVLAQVALGLLYRRRPRSLTQLVVAALEHRPQGEFSECQNDEDRLAKTRFVVNDRDDVAGGLSFKHVL